MKRPSFLSQFRRIYREKRVERVTERAPGYARVRLHPLNRRAAAKIAWRQARLARSVW